MNKDQVNHLDEKQIDLTQLNDARTILRGLPGKESREARKAIQRACALNGGSAKITQSSNDTVEFEFKNGTTGTYKFSKSDGLSTSGDGFTYHGTPVQDVNDSRDLENMTRDMQQNSPDLDNEEIEDAINGSTEDSGSAEGTGSGAASSGSSEGSGSDSGAGSGSSEGSGSDASVGSGSGSDASTGSGEGSGEGSEPGDGEGSGSGEGDAPIDGETPPTDDSTSALVEFFTDPKVLIGVAAVAGIASLFAILSKSIKARFRKTAKALYRLQKDFGGSKNGLDMDNAFKGQGARITDLLVKVFGFGKKGKGAIGLVPFVNNYQNEIKRDYISAAKAFNMISQAGKDNPGAEIEPQKESLNIPTYKSFREAFNARKLNESAYQGEDLNESVAATISSAMILGKLAYSAGRFIWSKVGSDGKPEPAQAVQVTKQSTREVCYSIMNCFFAKYFNMEGVSTKIGLDVNHLADIDKSNVDKFKKLVISMKGEQNNNERVSKMYSRVHKQYNEMLNRYFAITNKVVDNFVKYSKQDKKGNAVKLSEKEDNMLTSGAEKLRMEISRQRDLYENNFFRVVNAIVTSPEYIQYMDFIIENVIPVFETGNAGDADYVLSTMPRKNEYFLIRQTKNSTEVPNPDTIDMKNANVALVMVEDVKSGKSPVVKFKRIGLFKAKVRDAEIQIQEDGTVDYRYIDPYDVELDTKAYAKDVNGNEEGDTLSLKYTKWIALDPIQVVNYNGDESNHTDNGSVIGFERKQPDGAEDMVFTIFTDEDKKDDKTPDVDLGGLPADLPEVDFSEKNNDGKDTIEYKPDLAVNENGEEVDKVGEKKVQIIKFVTKDSQGNINKVVDIKPQKEMTVDDVKNLLNNDNLDGGNFKEIPSDNIQKENVDKLKSTETKAVNNTKEIVGIINNNKGEEGGNEENDKSQTNLANRVLSFIAEVANKNVTCKFDSTINKTLNIDNKNELIIINEPTSYSYDLKIKYKNQNITLIVSKYLTVSASYINRNNKTFTQIGTNTSCNIRDIVSAVENVKPENANKINLVDENGVKSVIVGNNFVFLEIKVNNGSEEMFKYGPFVKSNKNIEEVSEKIVDILSKKLAGEQQTESVKIQYVSPDINESMTAVKLVRNAVFESNKNAYLVSMTGWGDGSRHNPAKFLEESVKSVICSATSYSDIAKAAKKDKNLNILPLTESTTYQVPMPYNRYAILTNGNPLYEAVAVITIDATPDHNITSSNFIGVTRIVK